MRVDRIVAAVAALVLAPFASGFTGTYSFEAGSPPLATADGVSDTAHVWLDPFAANVVNTSGLTPSYAPGIAANSPDGTAIPIVRRHVSGA